MLKPRGCWRAAPTTTSTRQCAPFCEHFYVTTSGFFSDPDLLCCVMEIGIDRIRFSVGCPFVDNPPATKWTETLPLCAEDKEKLLSGNAKRLLKL